MDTRRVRSHPIAEFMQNVSHEFRTPLTAIRASTEFLAAVLEGADPSTLQRLIEGGSHHRSLEIICRSLDRLDSVVTDMLELAAIESGALVLDGERVAIGALVSDAVTTVESAAAARRQDITSSIVQPSPWVNGDRQRLADAIARILTNSIQYSPEGSSIAIEARLVNGDAEIHVTDAGPGLDEADRLNVFEPFYRGKASLTTRGSGRGLGLAIARGIVNVHAGEISFGYPDSGASACIRLPAVA